MRIDPWSRRGFALATLAFAALGAACSDDDNGTGPGGGLVGSWTATSFVGLGQDFIALGMDLTLTLTNANTYTIVIENDTLGACEPGPDCTQNGNYTSTSTQITLDPDLPEETTTFAYTIQGSVLTLTGSIDGTPVTITFSRT
jgi:hypothetical protein